jgi:protein-tyrosine phosphatase
MLRSICNDSLHCSGVKIYLKAYTVKMANKQNNRRIELKGAYNFRDVGGYSTINGKTTDWRKLFRSDNLAKLTKSDLRKIEKLDIQLVVDLRSEEERTSGPNRLPMGNGIRIRNIEIADNYKRHKELKREIFYGKLGKIDLEKELLNKYRLAITDYRYELGAFFELLLNPSNYPAIVLCSAGKDRTGVVIALTLMALGVSKKTIMEDYMLSRVYLAPMITRMITKVRLLSFFRADILQLKKVYDTRVEYLNATFNAIDQKFGSAESCLDFLGMDNDKRKILRKILCS